MAEGHHKIIVLKALNEKNHTGYSLMAYIEQVSGRKPSSGSMYPLLKDLLKNGQINVLEKKNKKIYSLTKKGRDSLENLMQNKSQFMDYVLGHINAMSSIFGKLGNEDNIEMFRNLKKTGVPFGWLTEDVVGIRHEVLRLIKVDVKESEKEKIKKLFNHLRTELRKIKK